MSFAAASIFCHTKCKAKGACYNDAYYSVGGVLSCAQGCVIRNTGAATTEKCAAKCEVPDKRKCEESFFGHKYYMCGTKGEKEENANCPGSPAAADCVAGCAFVAPASTSTSAFNAAHQTMGSDHAGATSQPSHDTDTAINDVQSTTKAHVSVCEGRRAALLYSGDENI